MQTVIVVTEQDGKTKHDLGIPDLSDEAIENAGEALKKLLKTFR